MSDNSPKVVVKGMKGFLASEQEIMEVGDVIVVGRSRSADLSVRRSARLLKRDDIDELMRSEAFLSVSRRHVQIHYLHPDLVEVKDLSRNGTFVDGKRIDCIGLTDLKQRSHVLALGAAERLLLEMPAYKELGIDTEVRPDDD